MFASPLPRLTSTRTLVSDVCRTTTLMRNDPFPTSTPGRLCGRKSRAFVYPKALRFASRPRLGCALGNAEFSGQCSCVDGVGVDCHSKNCAVHLALTQTPKVFQAGNASGSIDGDVRRRGDLLDQGQVRSAELPFPMHCSYQNARQGEWVQPADNLLQVIIRGLLPAVGDNVPFPHILFSANPASYLNRAWKLAKNPMDHSSVRAPASRRVEIDKMQPFKARLRPVGGNLHGIGNANSFSLE